MMTQLLVQLSKNELAILLSALNYLSTKDEDQLQHHYGSIIKLYDKLQVQHDTIVKTENCACRNNTTNSTEPLLELEAL